MSVGESTKKENEKNELNKQRWMESVDAVQWRMKNEIKQIQKM